MWTSSTHWATSRYWLPKPRRKEIEEQVNSRLMYCIATHSSLLTTWHLMSYFSYWMCDIALRHWLFSTQPPPPQGARGRPSDFGFVEAQRLSLSNADRDSAPVADAVIYQLWDCCIHHIHRLKRVVIFHSMIISSIEFWTSKNMYNCGVLSPFSCRARHVCAVLNRRFPFYLFWPHKYSYRGGIVKTVRMHDYFSKYFIKK